MHKSSSEAIIGAGSVAGRTVQVCRYMTNRLTNTDITVMAGQAVAGVCVFVVKRYISKVAGVMAHGAVLVVGTGRYVIRQFTDTNHIIVAGVAATSNTGMVIGTSAKGTRGVTNTTVFSGRHMVVRFTARRITMTGVAPFAHNVRAGMIDESANESFGVMAAAAIRVCCDVGGHCG